jgi:hypothetical protein
VTLRPPAFLLSPRRLVRGGGALLAACSSLVLPATAVADVNRISMTLPVVPRVDRPFKVHLASVTREPRVLEFVVAVAPCKQTVAQELDAGSVFSGFAYFNVQYRFAITRLVHGTVGPNSAVYLCAYLETSRPHGEIGRTLARTSLTLSSGSSGRVSDDDVRQARIALGKNARSPR